MEDVDDERARSVYNSLLSLEDAVHMKSSEKLPSVSLLKPQPNKKPTAVCIDKASVKGAENNQSSDANTKGIGEERGTNKTKVVAKRDKDKPSNARAVAVTEAGDEEDGSNVVNRRNYRVAKDEWISGGSPSSGAVMDEDIDSDELTFTTMNDSDDDVPATALNGQEVRDTDIQFTQYKLDDESLGVEMFSKQLPMPSSFYSKEYSIVPRPENEDTVEPL